MDLEHMLLKNNHDIERLVPHTDLEHMLLKTNYAIESIVPHTDLEHMLLKNNNAIESLVPQSNLEYPRLLLYLWCRQAFISIWDTAAQTPTNQLFYHVYN
jgi:hypothetical protein